MKTFKDFMMGRRDQAIAREYAKDGIRGDTNDNYSREQVRALKKYASERSKRPGWQGIAHGVATHAQSMERNLNSQTKKKMKPVK